MSDALGPGAAKHPILRFVVTSTVFFVPPYLAFGLLLLLSEVGVGAAAALWAGKRRGRTKASFTEPPESRVAFVAVTLGAAVACGISLHRVAHGGELPGGVNVAPLFVVVAAFASMAAGLVAALIVSIPRALVRRAR
jgi:peptidoglycan/LPS O-acetylase OafA/YrhL